MRENVRRVVERLRRLEAGEGEPWRTETYGPQAPHDVEEDRRELSLAFIATADRLKVMVEDYLKMGADAERVGHDRRAASYRSVANMLAVALGGHPVVVDFLARFEEESEATRKQVLLGDALHKMLVAAGVYGDDSLATGPELLAAVEDYTKDDREPVTPEWCASAGGRQKYGGPYIHRWYWDVKTQADDRTHVLVSFGDGDFGKDDPRTHLGICGSRLMYNPTRGDVRRLLAAFKPAKEQ